MKLALMRTATGKEDQELPLLQRISSLEFTTPLIAAQSNASQSSSNRHISTSTVQWRLCESGLHVRIAAKKPLLKDSFKTVGKAFQVKLVERMPIVCKAVIKAKGGYFEEI